MNAWYFYGRRQRGERLRAVTVDETGSNLPREFGPWEQHQNVAIPDSAEPGIKAIREALKEDGFFIHWSSGASNA